MNPIFRRSSGRTGLTWIFPLYILAMLLYLLAGLPRNWGPPEWFGGIPYVHGLKFFLALEFYFRSGGGFFFCCLAVSGKGRRFRPVPVFVFCFLPVVLFSVFVLAGGSYQFLDRLFRATDLVLWAAALGLAFFGACFPLDAGAARGLRGCFVRLFLPGFFFLSALVPLIFPVPAFFLFILRILALIFSLPPALVPPALPQGGIPEPAMPPDAVSAGPALLKDRFGLSARETEVLTLLLEGKGNREIGEGLFISLSTVKTHMGAIFAKTGVKSRMELAALRDRLVGEKSYFRPMEDSGNSGEDKDRSNK